MRFWYQNLKKEDREKKLFNFRGSVGPDDYRKTWFRYQLCSGPSFKLKYQHGEADDGGPSSMLILGFFFFTAYITFYLPERFYFTKKCIATWEGNREFYLIEGREYGFYFYNWAWVWSFHAKINESNSKDPWWMRQYIHIDELILGKTESLKDDLVSIDNVKFMLGDKEFNMDSIKWVRYRRFRRFIPYVLFHRTWYSVDMKIDKPPMRAGKGENSWDCDDDGAFGVHRGWEYEMPTWQNRDACAKLAVDLYVSDFFKDVKRYGGGSDSDRGIQRDAAYKYIGVIREGNANEATAN